MNQIEQENTLATKAENRDSNEEMSYSEIFSDFLGEFVPGRGRIVTCSIFTIFFLVLTFMLWSSFGWKFYTKCPKNGATTVGVEGDATADLITKDRIRLIHRTEDGAISAELPPWIHDDLKTQIVRSLATLHHRSIYDDKQIGAVRSALKEAYWIKSDVAIKKYYPPFLEIEVIYRRPALLVAVSASKNNSGTDSNGDDSAQLQYIPLSDDGRILPMDLKRFPVPPEKWGVFPAFAGFAPPEFLESEKLIDITDFPGYTRPTTEMEGQPWHDGSTIIQDAIAIVNLLGERWERFGLDYICVLEKRNSSAERESGVNYRYALEKEKNGYPFCIVTRNGSRIYWGERVATSDNKEAIPDIEKLAQLDKMYKQRAPIFTSEQVYQLRFRHPHMTEKQNLPSPKQ